MSLLLRSSRGIPTAAAPTENVGLEVYSAVNSAHISPLYTARVSKGGSLVDSPVLYTDNPYYSLIDGSPTGINHAMHWMQISADFSSGGPVTIEVTLASASVASARVRCGPWSSGGSFTPTINTGAHTITFTLSTIGQYYVYIPSKEVVVGTSNTGDPLFIWIDTIETPPVVNGTTIKNFTSASMSMTGVDELVFQPSATDWDLDPNYVSNGNVITEWLTAYGKSIYIHGGAWVKGMLDWDGGSGVGKLRGRGTLSGEKYLLQAEDNSNIIIHGLSQASSTFEASGITVLDSPSKNFICDVEFHLSSVKWFGMTGDCATMRANSTADRCFTMVNDDHYKLYYSNCSVTKATMYLQKVGGIQCSWQATTSPTNCVVDECHVLAHDRPGLAAPGTYTQQINAAIIVCANVGSGSTSGHLTDYIFSNFTSDVPVWQVFSFALKWNITGFEDGLGDLDGFEFHDFDIPGVPGTTGITYSHFNANGTAAGTIKNFLFDNVVIGGTKVTSANRASYFKWSGNDDQATFSYT